MMKVCCICGKQLPNRFALAGTCEADGCDAAFCAMHWTQGNRRCREHGWKSAMEEPKGQTSQEPVPRKETEMADVKVPESEEKALCEEAKRKLPKEQAKKIMASIADLAVKGGKSAGDLIRHLCVGKNLDEMQQGIQFSLDANKAKTDQLSNDSACLYKKIAEKKKIYEAASPARKKMLEMELRNLLAEYHSIESQYALYTENVHVLTLAKGRLLEQVAVAMQTLREKDLDTIAIKADQGADKMDGLQDAVRDMEKAGKRHDRAGEAPSLEDELAGFDEIPEEKAEPEKNGTEEKMPEAPLSDADPQ